MSHRSPAAIREVLRFTGLTTEDVLDYAATYLAWDVEALVRFLVAVDRETLKMDQNRRDRARDTLTLWIDAKRPTSEIPAAMDPPAGHSSDLGPEHYRWMCMSCSEMKTGSYWTDARGQFQCEDCRRQRCWRCGIFSSEWPYPNCDAVCSYPTQDLRHRDERNPTVGRKKKAPPGHISDLGEG